MAYYVSFSVLSWRLVSGTGRVRTPTGRSPADLHWFHGRPASRFATQAHRESAADGQRSGSSFSSR